MVLRDNGRPVVTQYMCIHRTYLRRQPPFPTNLRLKVSKNYYHMKRIDIYFYQKNVHFTSKNSILCLFLKNLTPSKRVECFILNNLYFSVVESIAFYALYKSRVLIIPREKQMTFVYLWGYHMKFKKKSLVSSSNLEFNFSIVLWSNLKKTLHY